MDHDGHDDRATVAQRRRRCNKAEHQPPTVYRLAEAGLLPGVRVGSQWRFDGAQLEA
jgi:hypothetical protein